MLTLQTCPPRPLRCPAPLCPGGVGSLSRLPLSVALTSLSHPRPRAVAPFSIPPLSLPLGSTRARPHSPAARSRASPASAQSRGRMPPAGRAQRTVCPPPRPRGPPAGNARGPSQDSWAAPGSRARATRPRRGPRAGGGAPCQPGPFPSRGPPPPTVPEAPGGAPGAGQREGRGLQPPAPTPHPRDHRAPPWLLVRTHLTDPQTEAQGPRLPRCHPQFSAGPGPRTHRGQKLSSVHLRISN